MASVFLLLSLYLWLIVDHFVPLLLLLRPICTHFILWLCLHKTKKLFTICVWKGFREGFVMKTNKRSVWQVLVHGRRSSIICEQRLIDQTKCVLKIKKSSTKKEIRYFKCFVYYFRIKRCEGQWMYAGTREKKKGKKIMKRRRNKNLRRKYSLGMIF